MFFPQQFKVVELFEHPNYSGHTFDNDIAILILDKSVTIGKYVGTRVLLYCLKSCELIASLEVVIDKNVGTTTA